MRVVDRLADYSDESIIGELKRVASELGSDTLTMADLSRARICYATVKNRFGGLREALRKAGLRSPVFNRNIPDVELLQELQKVWDLVLSREGRRPYKQDLVKYRARFSQGPYYRRWGSWIKACEALMAWEEGQGSGPTGMAEARPRRGPRPKRPIPLRLRYEVLKRDNFSCRVCGRSPAKNPGQVELDVDHVIAEAKGGLTESGNLRTLCRDCNIGKGPL